MGKNLGYPELELWLKLGPKISDTFRKGRDWNGEGNGTPLQYSCLENPMDGGAWWATVHGVAKSRTRLSDFTFTFHFPALEKAMAIHSSVLAWRIPGMGEPGALPSMGSHRVRHDWSNLAAAVYNSAHSWVEFSMVEYFKMLKFILNTFQNGWTSLNLMASCFSRNPWWSSFSWIQFLVLNPLP